MQTSKGRGTLYKNYSSASLYENPSCEILSFLINCGHYAKLTVGKGIRKT